MMLDCQFRFLVCTAIHTAPRRGCCITLLDGSSFPDGGHLAMQGDVHGCPYKTLDKDSLRAALQRLRVAPAAVEEAVSKAKVSMTAASQTVAS